MSLDELRRTWQTIKSYLPNHSQFLHWWLLVTVFIIPLLIFNYGFNASVIRQFVLLVLAAVGWLIWVSPAVLYKQPLYWQRSIFNLPALILLAAILLNSLLAGDIFQVWGGRGVLAESNPWGALAALGLGLLIVQVIGPPASLREALRAGRKKERIQPLLAAYLLSVSVLALLVLLWWVFAQQLVIPAWTSFPAASLLFTANAIIIAAWSLPLQGKIKLFWLGVLLLHVAVIFAYDYDLAWYVLAAGGLVLSVAQLVWEKKLFAVDFRTPFALIILSVILLFVPVKSVSTKLGFDTANLNTVGASVAWPRFFKYTAWPEKLLGVGLGQGTERFWQTAELVDMRQAVQFPPLGNGWGGLLWDGGVLLILAWLAFFGYLALGVWRSVKKSTGLNLQAILISGIGVAGYLVISALMPLDWFGLFGLIVFMSLSATLSLTPPPSPSSKRRGYLSQGQRAFLSFGAAALAVGLLAGLIFAGQQIKNRLDFFNSIQVGAAASGTTVDLNRLHAVIERAPRSWGYRLARVDFFQQALDEQAVKPDADLKPLFAALRTDLDYLAGQNLPGETAWQMAATAEKVAVKAGQDEALSWLKPAAVFYEKAIAGLPRNVIFLTDAARFYRQQASRPPLPEGGLGGEGDQYLKRARELADKALAIDNTYEAAYGEKAELLVLAGKTEEAFASLKTIADQSPSAAYSAARLAFSAKKYDEAVIYYKKAIAQNANHLQARYELVQVYMALSDFKSAGLELDELEKRAPKDDIATQNLLKSLRELLK